MNNEEYRKNVEKKIAEIKKERGEVKYEFTNPVLEKGLKLVAYLDGKISLEEYRDPSFKYQDENNIKKTNAKQKQGFIKKLKHKIKMKQEEMRDLQLNIQIGNRQRDLCLDRKSVV